MAQKIYASLGNGEGLKRINITTTQCITDTIISCSDQNYFAIAVDKDTLYYADNLALYRGFFRNDTLLGCQMIETTPAAMSSLSIGQNGILYAVSNRNLYKRDPATGSVFELLGSMPYAASGDLVYFDNNLYLASPSGIVLVDLVNPGLSTIHIPMSTATIYGLAVLPVDCNQKKVFAFETIQAGAVSNVIELDLDNRLSLGIVCQIPFGVADAASDVDGGRYFGIALREITMAPKCNDPGHITLRVIREPGITPYTYTLNGQSSNTTGVFEDMEPGDYHIEITTAGGCYKDTMITVPALNPEPPAIQIQKTNADCTGPGKVWFRIQPDNGNNKVIYNSRDTLSTSWMFTSLNEGMHHFRIVDEYFCELKNFDIEISLEGSCDTVYFPTAFTPNNDGMNDLFRGQGNRSVQDFRLSLYNRWGELVFNSHNILEGWDGKKKGEEQTTGIYIWLASYTNREGISITRKGTVLLIR